MQSYDDYLNFAKAMGIQSTDLGETPAETTSAEAVDATPITMPDPDVSAQGRGKLAILLHGFNPMAKNPFTQEDANNGRYADYQRFFDAIKAQLPGYSHVVAAYDTHQSFATAGNNLYDHVFKGWGDRFDLSKTIIVGYSMGGLVARQMVMRGLPFARLYMTCTPNYGVMPYVFTLPGVPFFFHANRGARSMSPSSADLARLNQSDRHLHSKYYCHGVNYTDTRLFHNDDTITDCHHATMVGANVAHRSNTHIGMLHALVMEPHLRGYTDTTDWGGNWAAGEFVKQIRGV